MLTAQFIVLIYSTAGAGRADPGSVINIDMGSCSVSQSPDKKPVLITQRTFDSEGEWYVSVSVSVSLYMNW